MHAVPAALGASPAEIRAVAEGSPHYRDGVFTNLEPAAPLRLEIEESQLVLFEMLASRSVSRPPAAGVLADAPVSTEPAPLAVTWFGHSTALLEIDDYRVLTDPMWSQRCSPSPMVGPQRLHPVAAPLETLPALDAVLISHDHYDHLDCDTVLALARTQRAPFVVPLGVGAHLRRWGIAADRVIELDWNQSTQIGELTLVCTPARHFSGRWLARNVTLWCSWAVIGRRHRAYFAGDTGYTHSFAQIGQQYGPFDVTLMPIGAYNTAWPDVHMNPEEAVRAHQELTDTGLLIPIHWGTFRLAPHPWAEPVERLIVAADADGISIDIPKPGGRVIVAASAGSQASGSSGTTSEIMKPVIQKWWHKPGVSP